MADATVTVDAGVCRFKSVVIATMDDNMDITFKVKSECPMVRAACKEIGPIPVFEAVAMPFTENAVYAACSGFEHVSSPVPCAMIKAAEVAGDLALKKDVSLTFEE